MREIETKARVGYFQLDDVFTFFNAKYGKSVKLTKVDTHLRKKGADDVFRIRRIGERFWVNEKKRALEGDFENNSESEREVTREEAKRLEKENSPLGIKTKRCYLWKTDFEGNEVNIELADVIDLDIYLEIEALLPDDCPDSLVESAKAFLMGFYRELGLVDRIEKRKYLDLLFGC